MVAVRASTMPKYETGLTEIAPNLYAYLQYAGGWGLSNSGFLVGEDSVVLFDTLFTARLMEPFLEGVTNTGRKPVRFVINTHSHGDHTNGNQFFKQSPIISHVKCRDEMVAQAAAQARGELRRPRPIWLTDELAVELSKVERVLPNVTFDDELVIHHDAGDVQLFHWGPAHTTGDLIIYLPQQETVFLGDLGFFYCTPIAGASAANWITIIDRLLTLDASKFVSGHGPVGDRDALREQRAYLEFFLEEARQAIKKGKTYQEAAGDLDLGTFAHWGEAAERAEGNMRTAYRDLGAETEN